MAPGLRPVPFRPPGPVDSEQAARHVGAALPELDEETRRALALIEISGRPRESVAAELTLDAEALGAALHRGRKALRRSVLPLSSTGWCERAERLLSDELDGALSPPGPARLEAHLRHCGRCVEHERRLAQARDALVREYAELHGAPEAEEEAPPSVPPAELRIVPEAEPPALEAPEEAAALGAAEQPQAVEAAAEPEAVEAGAEEPQAVEAGAEEREAVEAVESGAEPAEPPASALESRVIVGVAAQGSAIWSVLHLLAIALAIIAAALTVLAATGTVERIF